MIGIFMTKNTVENRSQYLSLREILQNTAGELVDGIQALEVLSTMTEGEFLYVGSKLEDFYGRAAAMAEFSKSVAGLVSGDEIRLTMDGLRNLVDDLWAGSKNSEAMADVSLTKLKHILDLIEEVFLCLDDLERITRTLHMLGLSMIIQNATLASPVGSLHALGEDVRKLSAAIDEKAFQIAVETKGAAQSITSILSRLKGLQLTQQTKVDGILKKTQSGLSSLSEKYDFSAEITRDISEISATISGSVGNIVTSTQVHDITRQQFEGSARAFKDLLAALTAEGEDGGSPGEWERARRLVREVVHFCDSQGSSLFHAGDHFVSAAKEIIRNLKSLTGTVRTILGKTMAVMSAERSTSGSFLLRIESDLDSVRSALSALSETVQIGNEISGAIIVVARTAGKLSGFTDDVENIGDEIVLIALNAEVKAEGIGNEGRGLAVIAESVQRISVEAQNCIRGISRLLRSITSTADELSDGVVAAGGTVVPGEKKMSDGLRAFVESLRSVNGKLFAVLSKGEEFGRGLSSDIEEVSAAISVHESVDNVTAEIIANLQKIGSSAKRVLREDTGERRIYERVGEAKDPLHSERDGKAPGGSGEFGWNVELF